MEERVEKIQVLIALLKLAGEVELEVILALTKVVSSQAKFITDLSGLRTEEAHKRITENNIKIENTMRKWRRADTETHPLTITTGGVG